ncbi:MAG: type II toxin-antitoxin system PemK/MazF family toxin [Thermaerobacter sp.]|nr:type II toxin-antitoxin system PemK/MazF family toxin [Thermaerobacter sp.]
MTDLEPRSVVLVRFPFTDLSSTKRRPAIVVSTTAFHHGTHDVIVVAVTSVPSAMPADFPLMDWSAGGLVKPSWARAGKILTLHDSIVEDILGRVSERDWAQIRQAWDAALAPLSRGGPADA